MSTTVTPDHFTTLPDEHALQATVVALEEHGFSVEVVDDLDAARETVLARIPDGSSVMTMCTSLSHAEQNAICVFMVDLLVISSPPSRRIP